MRDIPEGLAAALDAPLTSLAWLWRLVRADGIALGFTTHDRTVRWDGMDYHPAPGMVPSATIESDGLDVEGLDVSGVLSSDAIRAVDIAAGRYDGARASLMLLDWTAPEAGALTLMSGTLADLVERGAAFEARLETAETVLSRVPVELTTPECRARLGDARCGVDLKPLRRNVTVAEIIDQSQVRVSDVDPERLYIYGVARPLSGALAGVDIGISRVDGDILIFDDAVAGLSVGDDMRLTQGCDRRWQTCRVRFGNGDRFRGEPHVPGRDAVLRYPGL
ncbi:DUF2163 domain-containing protein [Pacificimonas sp. WHA3]|uniref:DUF2163 domain-containing protein n=1 Tax=Pacificimonas pallii TaxID=2827236 RepID=A0ABS6SA05_9SPHN|nr:DUF2163 domain-containing protein [Pacificimonas pallii]MBV7255200.1 DUF2163 domain-containing protein [Pacificimonas pallii]